MFLLPCQALAPSGLDEAGSNPKPLGPTQRGRSLKRGTKDQDWGTQLQRCRAPQPLLPLFYVGITPKSKLQGRSQACSSLQLISIPARRRAQPEIFPDIGQKTHLEPVRMTRRPPGARSSLPASTARAGNKKRGGKGTLVTQERPAEPF